MKRQLPLVSIEPLTVKEHVQERLRDLPLRQSARDERRRKRREPKPAPAKLPHSDYLF